MALKPLQRLSLAKQLLLGAALRAGFIAYGVWHDARHTLKYTDIDYLVFSDAAAYLYHPCPGNHAQGVWGRHLPLGDPYSRDAYRYTPLLAVLLLPNEFVHPLFGKSLFAASDLVVALLLARLLSRRQGHSSRINWIVALVWLLNPMIINISTRGSSEALLGVLVLFCLNAAESEKWDLAAILLGLATHTKIYPFIYGVSCVMRLSSSGKWHSDPLGAVFNRRTIRFFVISATTFMALNGSMYLLWGKPFLDEALLYHFHRLDAAHNFSPAFYPIMLSRASQSTFATLIPQLFISCLLGVAYGKTDLGLAWFMQTAAFVTFNRVCTSQYFLWYLWLLPFAIARSRMSVVQALTLVGMWVGGQAIWLQWAYQLEFLHRPVHLNVWLASLGFQATNVLILGQLIRTTGTS